MLKNLYRKTEKTRSKNSYIRCFKNSLSVIDANRLFSYLQKFFSILQQITPCRTDMVRKEGYILFTIIILGGVILKPSDLQKTIQCQFDCKLKKVVKGIVRNYRKELARRQAKEVSFCELPEIVVEKLIVWDDYESEYTTFDVCGTEIRVLDEELAEALKQLPEQSRNIVLMFFFLDMSDSEIGEKLNINRSTSYRHRRNSLEEIRKQLKEKKTNEE